jgi:hypothetical protein
MKPTERVTRVEYQKRLDILIGLHARGLASSQLIKIACQQWNVSVRQAKRYIKKAKEQESQLAAQPLEVKYALVLQRFNYIYQQAIQLGDLELARRAAFDLVHLLKQEHKESLNASLHAPQSGILGFQTLEEFLQSFENTEADPPS